jgi:hypothetical protein
MNRFGKILVISVLFSASLIANEVFMNKSVIDYGKELTANNPCEGPIGPCAN